MAYYYNMIYLIIKNPTYYIENFMKAITFVVIRCLINNVSELNVDKSQSDLVNI